MTSAGPECTLSWAVPIPILNEEMRRSIGRPDREIPLPMIDVADIEFGRDFRLRRGMERRERHRTCTSRKL